MSALSFRIISACALGAGALCASAQSSISFRPNGPELTRAGAPFEAERITLTQTHLADGSTVHHEQHEILSRDADGRVLDDTFGIDANGAQTKHSFVLLDPVAARSVSWSEARPTGMEIKIRPGVHADVSVLVPNAAQAARMFPRNHTSVTTEPLPAREIAGLNAHGTRTTRTVAAGSVGNDAPLQATQEVWLSDDLQLVLEETDHSPTDGTRTVKVTRVDRTTPPASRFVVPENIKITALPTLPVMPPPHPKPVSDSDTIPHGSPQ